MAYGDILDLQELLEKAMNELNKDDLHTLSEELKQNHFPNVLSKSKEFREKYKENTDLVDTLLLIEATSHAQIGEYKASAVIIEKLYKEMAEPASKRLILLGQLAYMSDFKLARRIATAAVNLIEQEEKQEPLKLAMAYLVLAEAEEKLEKFVRSLKYYKKGLSFYEQDDNKEWSMILYLHFKIGMLHTTLGETEEAVQYLEKTIELAGEDNDDMKINSLVSIAKTYGAKENDDAAFPYLKEALQLLENSSLQQTMIHAEALTEMAFYYFNQSRLEEAVPLYKDAIAIYLKLPISNRKLGMIYMQYAYCLEHKKQKETFQASRNYELAIECLEKANDRELLENALADVIAFFDATKNTRKKREFEEKFVKMVNKAQ